MSILIKGMDMPKRVTLISIHPDGRVFSDQEYKAVQVPNNGKWIEQSPDFDLCGVTYYKCSECGKEQQTKSNYCQFCGSKMDVNEKSKWYQLPDGSVVFKYN